MTPEETQRIATLTARMTPRCIGRYLIDLPEAFPLGYNTEADAEIDGVKIVLKPMSQVLFDMLLKQRRKTLEAEKTDGEKTPSLMDVKELPNGAGLVFNRSNSLLTASDRAWELMAWSNGFMLTMTIESYNTDLSRYPIPKNRQENNVQEKLAQLLAVYARTRGRPESEIPTEPGFCIANGFVKGPAQDNEEAFVPFNLKDSPDLWFNISAIKESIKDEKDSLLDRVSKGESELRESGSETVRKGHVTYGKHPYEEWLTKGPTADRVQGTYFALIGNETRPGLDKPLIKVELFNGLRIPAPPPTLEQMAQLTDLKQASLSVAEAVALWDKVAPTLRLRPGAF